MGYKGTGVDFRNNGNETSCRSRPAFTSGDPAAYVVVLWKGGLTEVLNETATGGAETCFVCGQKSTAGVPLMHAFLCSTCEHRIAVVRVTDGEYDFFVRRLAEFWHELHEETVPSERPLPGTRGIMN